MSIHPSDIISACLYIICLSVCLSNRVSICLTLSPIVCLSIYLSVTYYTCKIMRTTTELIMSRDTALRVQSTRPLVVTRVLTYTIVTYLTIRAVGVLRAGTRDLRLDTSKLIADKVTTAVAINTTLDLLTADFLIIRIAVEAVGTGTNSAVGF